jgi:UDP-glucose 4-epimerase
MPYINLVALGKQDHLTVHGNDYPTRDGTGVRDYIHVVDLALGHLKALEKARKECGTYIYNLGTGKGYSVLEMVQAFERVNGIKIKYEIGPRRTGDIAECYADPTKAKEEIGWEATRDLEQMCSDGWNFAKKYL